MNFDVKPWGVLSLLFVLTFVVSFWLNNFNLVLLTEFGTFFSLIVFYLEKISLKL